MKTYVLDVEANALLKKATHIHCMCYQDVEGGDIVTLTDVEEMQDFLTKEPMRLVGNMMTRYDIPVMEKLLQIDIPWKNIDTLAISWYLEPERNKHSLESYAEEFGLQKVQIEEWETGTIESYTKRCQEDVRINMALWKKQYRYLMHLYEDEGKLNRFLAYIQFKLECIREQEEIGIKLDVEHCQRMHAMLEAEKEAKLVELVECMPQRALIDVKKRPQIMERKDGSISSNGAKWLKFLTERDITDNPPEVEYIRDYEPGNPNSHDQVKKWLYSLGWEPQNIKHVRDKKKNTVKKIPQIASKEGGGEVCDSIKLLFDKEPKLELLNGLTILSHRIGLFSGFLRDEEDGRLYPTINNLTNTMRSCHSIICNLPGPGKKYGDEVRACMIADEGHTLFGADLSGLENVCMRHYMYDYDREYVEQMSNSEYDSHLELAILAGLMTEEESNLYKELTKKIDRGEKLSKKEKEEYKRLKEVRFKAKTANYSLIYGCTPDTLARNSNWKLMVARRVHRAYWERNKSISQISEACIIKEIGARNWLQNPLSGFWHILRSNKDRFSTLAQSSGSYIFDLWVTYVRRAGVKVPFAYHDEICGNTTEQEEVKEIILEALEAVNRKVQMNVRLDCNVQFGQSYNLIH